MDFSLNLGDLKSFIAILLFSGYHKIPQEDIYWEQEHDVDAPMHFNSMPRNQFREINKFLHLNGNSRFDKNDKICKLRLLWHTEGWIFKIWSFPFWNDDRYYGIYSPKMLMSKPLLNEPQFGLWASHNLATKFCVSTLPVDFFAEFYSTVRRERKKMHL